MYKSNKILLVLLLVLGIFIGAGIYTFYYGEGWSYFSKDPKACVNCHIMQPQFDSWQKASHHAVANCADCHLPHEMLPKLIAKTESGFLHSKGFTLQDFPEPIFIREKSIKVVEKNCLHCHEDFVHDTLPVDTPGYGDLSCIHCHRSVGHGEAVGLGKYKPVKK